MTASICPRCLVPCSTAPTTCSVHAVPMLPLEDDPTDPRLGAVAQGRYLLLRRLGRGGAATVYLAEVLDAGRRVAVKVMEHATSQPKRASERFEREARVGRALASPRTVKVLELGRLTTGELFIAMELVAGRTLAEILRDEGRLPWPRAAWILRSLCLSLEDLHGRGIVHRDVKPSNVMVDEWSDAQVGTGLATTLTIGGAAPVKLLDLGLVKSTRLEDTQLTSTGEVFGTPAYMAPEQWSPGYGTVGPATDQYALGVVMHEMLTGRPPFVATALPRYAEAHLFDAPPPLSAARPDLAEARALEPIIGRCLEKLPADRFASIAELRAELARLAPG
ncbi:serine/threonine protein kinase [Myxococcota bacterium]|nr:serine/threonine protein kinase [Myxococcota bacterium]